MRVMGYVFVFGLMLGAVGVCCLVTYWREQRRPYTVVAGKIVDVVLSSFPREEFFGYTPIVEYRYDGKTYRVEHRITTPKPSRKYKVDDIVDVRVYAGHPQDGILDDVSNQRAPLLVGIGLTAAGMVLCVIGACLR